MSPVESGAGPHGWLEEGRVTGNRREERRLGGRATRVAKRVSLGEWKNGPYAFSPVLLFHLKCLFVFLFVFLCASVSGWLVGWLIVSPSDGSFVCLSTLILPDADK